MWLVENKFILLHWVFVAACRLSPFVGSRATLVAEHGYRALGLQHLQRMDPVVAAHRLQYMGLVCLAACGIFPYQGFNPYALH